MAELSPTPRTRVHRLPSRASYDRTTIHAILDEALVCHLGFVHDGQPFVLPTTYARVDDALYLHGSAASRMLRGLRDGIPVCVTVTLLDGLVLARSAFHHSMNYRSVVILGVAAEVTGAAERLGALEAIVQHVNPGRWQQVFLSSRSGTIWGGTAQVQRNIVGERVLGLPKEPRAPGGA